jgi:hypothetical protein
MKQVDLSDSIGACDESSWVAVRGSATSMGPNG